MQKTWYLLLLAASLAGCRHPADSGCPSTVVGRWQLIHRACYCPANYLPDETITFDDDQHFQLFASGQLAAEGTYAFRLRAATPCSPAGVRLLLTPNAPNVYAPSGAYTLQDCTLVLDANTGCLADAPRSTYQRMP